MPAWRERLRRLVSVRLRITAAAVVIVALAIGAAILVADRMLGATLDSGYDTLLADRIDEAEQLVRSGALPSLLPSEDRDAGQVQVDAVGGRVLAATSGLGESARFARVSIPPTGRQRASTVDASAIGVAARGQYRLIARTVQAAGGPVTIFAFASLRAAHSAETELRQAMLLGLGLIAVLVGVLAWWVVGRALAPVEAMRAAVDRIEGAGLGERIDAGAGDDEIRRLGITLNRMLGRLDDARRRQQLFAAAASHELRSPLSAIRTELEVGLTYPERADWTTLAQESLVEVERLERLAADMLALTRLQARPPAPPGRCDLSALLSAELRRRRPPHGVAYRSDLRPAAVLAADDEVVHLVRNLLDNAERHARAAIDVHLAIEDGCARLVVANDGPPIPLADRERVFDPFTRLDGARTITGDGAGLGLSIARGIAAGAGGSLVAADTADGAAFVARLPLAR